MGVVGFVRNNRFARRAVEQRIGAFEVMGLPGGEVETCRVAQGIDRGMDLRAQAAPAASNDMLLRVPPFAPALCW